MAQLVKGDPEQDFFEQNPELKYVHPFSKMIKDVGDKTASDVSWAIYMLEDINSQMYGFREEEKKKYIEKKYLNTEKFPWEEFQYAIDAYPNAVLTKKERTYKRVIEKFEGMVASIEQLDADGDLKILMDFYKSLDKMQASIDAVEESMKKERLDSLQGRGGQKPGGVYKLKQKRKQQSS